MTRPRPSPGRERAKRRTSQGTTTGYGCCWYLCGDVRLLTGQPIVVAHSGLARTGTYGTPKTLRSTGAMYHKECWLALRLAAESEARP
jgi:hypothetical protein